MDKVIGMGNALVDILAKLDNDAVLDRIALPKGSMQLLGEERYADLLEEISKMPTQRVTGGSAGNVMKGLAELGAAPGFIGKTAADANGDFYAETCKDMGVDFVRLHDDTLHTGVALTFISPDAQRTFGTYLGAASNLQPEDIRPEFFEGYKYFFIEGYLTQNHELIERAVDMARNAGLKICLDLASYNIVEADHEFFQYLLQKTDIVFANEEESYAFTKKEPAEALEELAKLCETVVVKTGKKGSLVARGSERAVCEALPADVVDTTGAGDSYAAGFLYGLITGMTLENCARTGTLLASTVVQHIGATPPAEAWNAIRAEVAKLK
ncbi:adenosine kinase [Pseudoprevotella muciniphila]|uniref:Adenosine kinase n=1 Tax=Pseudoprevotella muciniphila TaxID=2133944 RepID=A0A5P8E7N0_9BACT|nr:adenosine kinase [Pseudoprevotella muciniphila]QFQ13001.1 adenosine kinase [Pseudoprevotella muciniphila]